MENDYGEPHLAGLDDDPGRGHGHLQLTDTFGSSGNDDGHVGQEELEGQRGDGEAASCRICRGDETSDEPLFYPCKCSGSIRYVHQACLMEWLSRSGKRHCELCKTPFRFTKLYDPRMPASVPVPIFARQAMLQIVAFGVRILRWLLVLFVWLAWVPWTMRLMWRFLFWLADGAWIEHPVHYDVDLPGSLGTLSITAFSRHGLVNTTLNSQLAATSIASLARSAENAASTNPSLFQLFFDHMARLFWDDGTSTAALAASNANATVVSQPLMLRIGIRLFKGVFPLATRRPPVSIPEAVNTTTALGSPVPTVYRETLLSDVSYLKHFTKWPFVNRIIIDILEGQMITIFVMVFLILVFLIREWVVQQQPGAGAPQAPAVAAAAAVVAAPQPLEDQAGQMPDPGDTRIGEIAGPDGDHRDDLTNAEEPATDSQGTPEAFFPRTERDEARDAMTMYMSITSQSPYDRSSFEELRLADYARGRTSPRSRLPVLEEEPPEETHLAEAGGDSIPFLQSPRAQVNAQQAPSEATLGAGEGQATSATARNHNLGQTISDSTWSIATNYESRHEADDALASETATGPASVEIAAAAQRPQMPSRNALNRASRLHRVLEEERNKVAGDRWPGITTFMYYWNRGNCDPQVVLDLIHAENREEELAWIVQAMRRLQRAEETESDSEMPDSTASRQQDGPGNVRKDSEAETEEGPALSNSSRGSWQVVDDATRTSTGDELTASAAAATRTSAELRKDEGDPELPYSLNITEPLEPVADHGESAHTQEVPIRTYGGSREADTSDESGLPWPGRLPPDPETDSSESGPPTPVTDHEADGSGGNLGQQQQQQQRQHQRAEGDPVPAVPRTTWQSIGDLMWGGVELLPADQEHVAGQLQPVLQPEMEHDPLQAPPAAPAGGAGAAGNQEIGDDANERGVVLRPDPEVLQAAREAGLDPEDAQAVEEAEELDGLVELIGLEGPLIALLQHAIVCAAIVSLVVFLGIWIPYILGKVALVVISNPVTLLVKLPLRCVFFAGEVLLDALIFLVGGAFFWLDKYIRLIASPVGWFIPFIGRIQQNTIVAETALDYCEGAMRRLLQYFSFNSDGITRSDIPYFSILAHESLVTMKQLAYGAMSVVYATLCTALERPGLTRQLAGTLWWILSSIPLWTLNQIRWEVGFLSQLVTGVLSALTTNPVKLRLDFPERGPPDLSLIHWSAWDRFFAISLGYLALYIAGCVYTKAVEAFKNPGDPSDDTVEIIHQARGVLKVILIISIEMIAFPLYCGILLDIAMLPLFRDATVLSRLDFTARSPWTSLFLHWFVGTCYMFHFALFVSMCRKEMRKGVLYFIRDPDDETFHPVRDVLERNLGGQLRKIAFSALVYGALVIVCLGTVVWSVVGVPGNVFPVSWSSSNPTGELPIDLCIYNFLIPIAVRALNPSHALTSMYKWWFRKCARMLHMSHFLFGERRPQEEGYWELDSSREERDKMDIEESSPETRQGGLPTSRTMGEGQNEHAQDYSEGRNEHEDDNQTEPMDYESAEGIADAETVKAQQRGRGRFVRVGRFVRAPATDRVRIPRGQQTFLPVDEHNNRMDGRPEATEGLHAKNNEQFQLVYLPPNFRLRIALFAAMIWGFAAVTGLLTTVLPLVIGRVALSRLLPPQAPTNDIHAYVFGAYALGAPLLIGLRYEEQLKVLYGKCRALAKLGGVSGVSIGWAIARFARAGLRTTRVLYFYSFVGFILPTLFSAILWFYVAVPVYTVTGERDAVGEQATNISLIQNWVLGVLFMRVAGRVVQNHQESRVTRALYAIVARNNGGASWLDPDVRLATRAFILPSLLVTGGALAMPLAMGYAANATYFRGGDAELQTLVYRFSYPAVAGAVGLVLLARLLGGAYRTWRSRIRDEVYLVGERLHNFGEKRGVVTTDRVASAA